MFKLVGSLLVSLFVLVCCCFVVLVFDCLPMLLRYFVVCFYLLLLWCIVEVERKIGGFQETKRAPPKNAKRFRKDIRTTSQRKILTKYSSKPKKSTETTTQKTYLIYIYQKNIAINAALLTSSHPKKRNTKKTFLAPQELQLPPHSSQRAGCTKEPSTRESFPRGSESC